eukprot:4402703-Ditylum_brightwellii.AAC.1
MPDVSHPDNPIAVESRNTIESEAAVLVSATATIKGRNRPTETRHGLPQTVDKITEDRTTPSFIINSSADAQEESDTRQSIGDLNSQ